MDDLRGFLGIIKMDRIPNARIRELCRVKKGLDEKRMVQGKNEWWGFVRVNAWGVARGMNP